MKQANKQTISLQRITIASPCAASWDKMQGDERVRHCGDCNKNVFNLSAMPDAAAAALLADNHSGELCVRFYQRQDGTVMTSDCGDSPRAAVRQAWQRLPHMAGVAVLAFSAAAAVNAAAPAAGAGQVAAPPAPPMMMMGAPPPTPERAPEASVPVPAAGKTTRQTTLPKRTEPFMGRIAVANEPMPAADRRAQGANEAGKEGARSQGPARAPR